jgi:hypothetical protein
MSLMTLIEGGLNRCLWTDPTDIMKTGAIISRAESLQILKNELRKAALEKRSAELKEASVKKRVVILAEIEREIGQKYVDARGGFAGGTRLIEVQPFAGLKTNLFLMDPG